MTEISKIVSRPRRHSHFSGLVGCIAGVLLGALSQPTLAASLEAVGSSWRPDVSYPQFQGLWSEAWSLKNQAGESIQYSTTNSSLGTYLQVYLHNASTQTVTIDDVKFEGISLTNAIAFSGDLKAGLHPASLHFSKLPTNDVEKLVAAGEPVWWKADPRVISPNGFAEIAVRFRRNATSGPRDIEVLARDAGCTFRIPAEEQPQFAGLSFNPELTAIHAYVRHPRSPAGIPAKVLLDGENVTDRTSAGADPAVDTAPMELRLAQPLTPGSFHCLQAIYPDGSTAISAIRAWGGEFVYGMWGYINQGKTPQERVDYYLGDLKRHNVNAVMESYGGEVTAYLAGPSGVEHSRTTGIRAMRNQPGKVLNPLYYFLTDEPDAHDYSVNQLKPLQRLGALAQALVVRSEDFRRQDPATPQLLNIDNTYKPENWYMYARLADVCCADPYFQEQQRIVWNNRPGWAAAFTKPTYVLGVATICGSACAPKPLHIILNSVRHDTRDGGFRFATPAEKTIELFYALGGGAKGFSYWWYTPYGEFHGCGAGDDDAVALWRQIGLLGAQVRTAGPLLTRSCPATLSIKAPPKSWTRTLLVGTNTLVLLVVNDNIASDRMGTVVVPLPKTDLTVSLPAWLKPADAFEIAPQGIQNVTWNQSEGRLQLSLGQTDVARMIAVTASPDLRNDLQNAYRTGFATNVAQLEATSKK